MRNILPILWLFVALSLPGQTVVGSRTAAAGSTHDYGLAKLLPPSGAALPLTCSTSQMFFKTTSPAGENLHLCTAPDTWTQIVGGGGGGVWGTITGTLSDQTDLQAALDGKQAVLGFTPENAANKSDDEALGVSATLYPTQRAVKVYVDTGLATKQNSLGFTPEDVANKSDNEALGTSTTLYPTQRAVKVYVDTGLATKQNSLGFTPEDVANKSDNEALGASTTLYPTQRAVKTYVDAAISGAATAAPNYSQSFSSQTTVALVHNLNTVDVLVACFDNSTPPVSIGSDSIELTDADTVTVTFTSSQSGNCVVNGFGGGFDKTKAQTLTNVTAPGTPAAGFTSIWTDATDKTLKAKDDAGVVTTTAKPDAGTSNQFFNSMSAAGVFGKAQPSFANLSGSATIGQLPASVQVGGVDLPIDGGGAVIPVDSIGLVMRFPYTCTISEWTIGAPNESGSIEIDIQKSTYSGFPTMSSICSAGQCPFISSAQKNQSTDFTDWTTTTITAGDSLKFVVSSVTSLTYATLNLKCDK